MTVFYFNIYWNTWEITRRHYISNFILKYMNYWY